MTAKEAVREREEAVRKFWEWRWSDPVIADRVGCATKTVIRIRRRLGLSAWEKSQQMRQMRKVL